MANAPSYWLMKSEPSAYSIEQLAADQVGPLPQFLQSLQITELRLGVGALGGQHVQKADFALAITGRDQVQRLLGFGQDGRLQGLDLDPRLIVLAILLDQATPQIEQFLLDATLGNNQFLPCLGDRSLVAIEDWQGHSNLQSGDHVVITGVVADTRLPGDVGNRFGAGPPKPATCCTSPTSPIR